jgi:hypothetical protein
MEVTAEKRKAWATLKNVIRLGEFSPIGYLFTLGSFLTNTEVTQIFRLLLSTVQSTYASNFDKNWVGLHFMPFFSQTHLVTLSKTLFDSFQRLPLALSLGN